VLLGVSRSARGSWQAAPPRPGARQVWRDAGGRILAEVGSFRGRSAVGAGARPPETMIQW